MISPDSVSLTFTVSVLRKYVQLLVIYLDFVGYPLKENMLSYHKMAANPTKLQFATLTGMSCLV